MKGQSDKNFGKRVEFWVFFIDSELILCILGYFNINGFISGVITLTLQRCQCTCKKMLFTMGFVPFGLPFTNSSRPTFHVNRPISSVFTIGVWNKMISDWLLSSMRQKLFRQKYTPASLCTPFPTPLQPPLRLGFDKIWTLVPFLSLCHVLGSQNSLKNQSHVLWVYVLVMGISVWSRLGMLE